VCNECLHAPKPLEADYYCASCKTPFANAFPLDERGLCAACQAGLRGFDRAASFGFYEGALRDLIHLYKYAGMRKRWRRGFNQSEILARSVSRLRAVPYLDALQRVRAAEVQAGLGKTARRRNVAGAFAVRRGANVQGKRVLLIDDVMTTGATATACGLALKRAGATSVSLFTLARVDRRWRT
jgi:predicted amidophosphoribosyltransferase